MVKNKKRKKVENGKKKLVKFRLFLFLGMVFLAIILIFLNFSSKSIADCKDNYCIESFAISSEFVLSDCELTSLEFRDHCYYIFGIENPRASEVKISEYCLKISNKDLYANCVYYSTGEFMASPNDQKNMVEIISSLDKSKCQDQRLPRIEEECLQQIEIISGAVENSDMSICSSSKELSPISRNICFNKVIEKMGDELNSMGGLD